jgi:hypothetical protein
MVLIAESGSSKIDWRLLNSDGSIGQAHYAGANRTLEALAQLRRAQGLPALTIAWGAIGETGFLAHHTDVARFLSQSGVGLIPVKEALVGLGELLDSPGACGLDLGGIAAVVGVDGNSSEEEKR